jgi:hypothetical protein
MDVTGHPRCTAKTAQAARIPEAESILNGVTVRQIDTCCIAAELCLQPSSFKGLGMTQARL